jgi:hypothetical protein|tara:strand:+ start:978 stop:1271 length:294 start_codon:yes stop_codon:yes gene_type:complete
MATKKEQSIEDRLNELESAVYPDGKEAGSVADAITGIISVLQHLLKTVGDMMHDKVTRDTEFMQHIGWIFESLGGEVVRDEPEPDDKPDLTIIKGDG